MVRTASMALLLLVLAAEARAEERPFCPDRPGKGSPPCVMDRGRFQVEVSAADALFSRGGGVSVDDVSYGALELRLGLTDVVEGQLTWTPRQWVRTKDQGVASTVAGSGDLGMALRWSLKNPSGEGLSVALQPFVVAPTGARGISGEVWQGGLIAPISLPISDTWSLSLAPEIDARANAAGDGRHLAFALAAGVGRAVGPVNLGAELWVDVDDDPSGRITRASFDLTAAWTPPGLKDVQLDAGAYLGLNRKTPDLELVVGIARRF